MNRTFSVGILSDSHSQISRMKSFARQMRVRGIEVLIHCGDITSPEAVEALREFEVHWVFGNCDWDHAPLERAMNACGHRCHGIRGELNIGGRVLAFTHGDRLRLLQSMILDPGYDLVIHGHTHKKRDVHIDGRRVVCPGALVRVAVPTAVILDVSSLEAEFVEIEDDEDTRISKLRDLR